MKLIGVLIFSIIISFFYSENIYAADIPYIKIPINILIPKIKKESENKFINSLTGLKINENLVNKRPIAVVINNLDKALPQSGIDQADLYYEVLAEGGITRIVAIFKDFNSKKIGPVRSVRDYFLNFVIDNNGILVHHGGSPKGYSDIKRLHINNLDGIELEGKFFWRDPVRIKQKDMKEHSSYINSSNIFSAIDKKKYELIEKNCNNMFDFYGKETIIKDGKNIKSVKLYFGLNQISEFIYDDESCKFKRYQNNKKQVDSENGHQLEVENIIIQKVKLSSIAGDKAGRIEVKLVGKGEGYLLSKGVYVPIKWEKKSENSVTNWYDINGIKLKLNKGKSWICVFQNDGKIDFYNDDINIK